MKKEETKKDETEEEETEEELVVSYDLINCPNCGNLIYTNELCSCQKKDVKFDF